MKGFVRRQGSDGGGRFLLRLVVGGGRYSSAITHRERKSSMSLNVDSLMLQAHTAIMEDKMEQFRGLLAQGRKEEAAQKASEVLTAAATVLTSSSGLLEEALVKLRQRNESSPSSES